MRPAVNVPKLNFVAFLYSLSLWERGGVRVAGADHPDFGACGRTLTQPFSGSGRGHRRWAQLTIALLCVAVGRAQAAPGDLLEAVAIEPPTPAAKAWRIRYETTDPGGRSTESTGVVVTPVGEAAARNVLAWAHGTVGVVPACAPSIRNPFGRIPALPAMLAHGWTVVATDYPGLGTPGPHRYLDGEAAGRAVLDSVRAAHLVPAAQAGTRFAVWGHSQGGHAALWTGQLAPSYAPELTLVGVAAAAPPTDLAANWAAMNKRKRAGVTALLGVSWSAAYGLRLSDLGDARTQQAVREAGSRCDGDPATARADMASTRVRARLRLVDVGTMAPWRAVMDRSAAGRAGAALLITQGTADDIITPEVTEDFATQACRRGEAVQLATYPGGHGAGVEQGAMPTVDWLAAQFAGRAQETSC